MMNVPAAGPVAGVAITEIETSKEFFVARFGHKKCFGYNKMAALGFESGKIFHLYVSDLSPNQIDEIRSKIPRCAINQNEEHGSNPSFHRETYECYSEQSIPFLKSAKFVIHGHHCYDDLINLLSSRGFLVVKVI